MVGLGGVSEFTKEVRGWDDRPDPPRTGDGMKKPRPEWLEKKIKAERQAREKQDPELSTKLAQIRRENWLREQEFRAITRE